MKKNVRKKNADERALEIENFNFKSRVKNNNKQLAKWRSVKDEMEQLNLNENDFKKLTNQQLRKKLCLKKRIDDKSSPNTKDNLI